MINVLKKGLKTLKKHVASHKTQLEANLKAGNIISADDKAQRENAAANNGDNNIDNDALIAWEPPPSCHEALQAKSTIEKYIVTIGEPYACKLESILVDFAHSTWLNETQKMKVSLLTDYFARK